MSTSPRRGGLAYRTLAGICVGVLALLGVLVATTLVGMLRALDAEDRAMTTASELSQLGAELGAASDLLTGEARAYSVTGDRAHLDAYWAEITTTKTRDRVLARMKELGVPPELLDLLAEAKAKSDALVTTETRSQRLMLEATGVDRADMPGPVADFTLSAEDGALSTSAKKATSARIMFDAQYTADKALIMEPVGRFQTQLDEQSADSVARADEQLDATVTRMIILIVLLGLGVAGTLWADYALVGRPGTRYMRALASRNQNDLSFQLSAEGVREMRQLATAFNSQFAQVATLVHRLDGEAAHVAESAGRLDGIGREVMSRTSQALDRASEASAASAEVAENVGAGAA